jgi:hypothetical protein
VSLRIPAQPEDHSVPAGTITIPRENPMPDSNEIVPLPKTSVSRRRFLQVATVGAGAVALNPTLIGCGGNSSSSASTTTTSSPWSFGIMADAQWTVTDDGKNPYTCSAEAIRQINNQFINNGVEFVIHVGDLCDGTSEPTSAANGELIRAAYTQTLYNNNIGFFPLRGNHDDNAALAAEFQTNYPQTVNGVMNSTPSAAMDVTNPDATNQPIPTKSGSTFTVGSNFSSPDPWGTGDLKGLSYSVDVNGSRFILLDQFTPTDSNASYNASSSIAEQQLWITAQLKAKPSGGHAFVFAHKGLITESHVDVLFGSSPSVNQAYTDAFIESLASNGVHLYINGHDHMHDRSLVYTTDGKTASVMQIVSQSDSSKFYIPNNPSNDETYNVPAFGVSRQVPIRQELYKVGYYLVTIDGNNATVEYWAADVNAYAATGEYLVNSIPTLNFTLRESCGYSLVGQQFQIAQGSSFTTVKDTSPNGTVAEILSGSNLSIDQDGSGRALVRVVNTGWSTNSSLASDILTLWGMQSDLGSEQSETYTLQISIRSGKLTAAEMASGTAGIATLDDSGNWTNAVKANYGGTKKFVAGAWDSSYTLGTYGIDATNNVAWAVINYGGKFAVTNNI